MAKAKVKQRKDSKGRVLQKGESQRKLDGMYIYTYVNPYGKRCYVYSKDLFTLREKEQELIKAQMDGLDYYVGGHATINMTFDRYMSTKHNLRETTRSNYLYMFNRFIREDFGNKFLTEVKYTDVKLFYYHLLNEKDIAINTLVRFILYYIQFLIWQLETILLIKTLQTEFWLKLNEIVERIQGFDTHLQLNSNRHLWILSEHFLNIITGTHYLQHYLVPE